LEKRGNWGAHPTTQLSDCEKYKLKLTHKRTQMWNSFFIYLFRKKNEEFFNFFFWFFSSLFCFARLFLLWLIFSHFSLFFTRCQRFFFVTLFFGIKRRFFLCSVIKVWNFYYFFLIFFLLIFDTFCGLNSVYVKICFVKKLAVIEND